MMRPGDENAKADVESGVYEKHYRLQAGDVVLDIGAHVGYFTEMAAGRVGAVGLVVAFEPHHENFGLLRERVGQMENVMRVKAVVSGRVGFVGLWENTGNTGGHSIYRNSQHGRCVEVRSVKASDYAGKVRFVKLDAEGAELEILTDLVPVLRAPVDIAFEAHSGEMYRSCRELLVKAGYGFEPMTEHVGVCYGWL